jgi:aldehyde dehydrogenase (NAD+)
MAKTFRNFIGGEWVAPANGAYFDNRNPADTDDLIGRFPDSDAADLEAAVRSAQRGFALWSRTPAPARGDVLRRVGDLLVERKEAIAEAMTREMGKVLAETRGDVQEGIDTAYYAATEGRRLFGHTVPSELRSKWAMSFRGRSALWADHAVQLPAAPDVEDVPALLCGVPSSSPPGRPTRLSPVEICSRPDSAEGGAGAWARRRWARRWSSTCRCRSSPSRARPDGV